MKWNGVKTLVTGGAGFIGSHVVDAIVARGAEVTVLDNLQAGKVQNLAHVMPHIQFIEADVRDADSVNKIVKGKDFIFHLAANASVPNSVEDPRYDFETNALGTFNVLEAAHKHEACKVIYASTAAVYGEPQYVPINETHPLDPCSFYGRSKLTGEREGFLYHQMYGLNFVAIRIFNTYGPRQPRYVMADLLRKLLRNSKELEVLGDGTQVRDYCYVTDTAEAIASATEKDEMIGNAYNIAGGNPVSIKDLVTLILKTMNLENTRVRYTGQSWKGDINKLVADITKLRGAGFSPKIVIETGVHNMVEWFHKN